MTTEQAELLNAAELIVSHYGHAQLFDDLSGPHRSAITLARHYLATHADGERVIDADAIHLAVEAEQGRWQQAIYERVSSLSGSDTIDGAGCESSDPLDMTLSEIHQAWNVRENADFDREQEGKEPITEAWLREIGFVDRNAQLECGAPNGDLVAFSNGMLRVNSVLIQVGVEKTRHQLLHLLSALGVEAKGAK